MKDNTDNSEPIINPQQVEWKYFILGPDGTSREVESGEGKNVIAIINTSAWHLERSNTPYIMKNVISRMLNQEIDGRKANICIAVPCSPLEEMRQYYGNDFADIDNAYVCIRMHDDLRKGDCEFIDNGMDVTGTMPPKEGAQQIASAIENGFHIWAWAGGNTLFPKLRLCERYFVSKGREGSEEKKPYFISFSDGSTAQFNLQEDITPVHYFGVGVAMSDHDNMQALLTAIEGDENLSFRRVLQAYDIEQVKHRYDEIVQHDDVISNVTFFPNSLLSMCHTGFPKFKSNEKIILGVEGYSQLSAGCNVHESLYMALSSGAIDANRVLFISMEDIVQKKEQFHVERVNGLIPDYEDLSQSAKRCINSICDDLGMLQQEYIDKSNAISRAEYARIEEVAHQFGIPVVMGGNQRAGHAKSAVVQPRPSELEFNMDKGQIIQVSKLTRDVKEQTRVGRQPGVNPSAPDWSRLALTSRLLEDEVVLYSPQGYCYDKSNVTLAFSETAQRELGKAKLISLNAKSMPEASVPEDVIVGNSFNIAYVNPMQLQDQGVVVHVTTKTNGGRPGPATELYQLIESEQLQAAKFVVISMPIPEEMSEEKRAKYVENRNAHFAKLFADFKIDKPVFITDTSIDHSQLPSICCARINLQEMVVDPSQGCELKEVQVLDSRSRAATV